MYRIIRLFSGLIIATLLSCNKSYVSSEKPVVFVSILPQKYFVEKIIKDLANIEVLVPPGSSPHIYEPKPSQMTLLSKASIYFATGIELEYAWLPKIKKINPKLKIIQTDKNIDKILSENSIPKHPEVPHKHDHINNHHSHHGTDPHIWLSPELVKKQSDIITKAFIEYDSTWRDTVLKNNKSFQSELRELQDTIKHLLSECEDGKPFLVFHPSWGYFAREFNLVQVPVEVQGKEPGPKELGKVLKFAKNNNIKTIFVQPGFSKKSAGIIAKELNGIVLTADPLSLNWSQNLINLAKAIKYD
ncbi:MAG: zinc ABC transporter solute-binding protein [Fibrobacter sp.]|nr:zinc ABC transporter solute-binding protein [Fibrobacter sp.]